MSQNYTTEVIFPVEFTHIPQGQILTRTHDSVVLLKLNSRGYDLLDLTFLKKRKPININLSGKKIHKSRYSIGNFILTNEVKNQIRDQLEFTDKLIEILPDTLKFKLESIASKEVTVLSDISYSLKPQHQIYGELGINPQTITLFGPPSVIDTIEYVKTENVSFQYLDKNIEIKLLLKKPTVNKNIKFSSDSIELYIPVEKFTEGVIDIPIEIKNAPQKSIKLFPDKVIITYLIALKDYSNFKADMISAGIEFDSSKKKQIVNVLQKPSYVKITNINPKSVEYLLIK
jgi:hypothetical protein